MGCWKRNNEVVQSLSGRRPRATHSAGRRLHRVAGIVAVNRVAAMVAASTWANCSPCAVFGTCRTEADAMRCDASLGTAEGTRVSTLDLHLAPCSPFACAWDVGLGAGAGKRLAGDTVSGAER